MDNKVACLLFKQALEAMEWMTGAEDFAPEGKARVGFERLVQPAIDQIRTVVSNLETEAGTGVVAPVPETILSQLAAEVLDPDAEEFRKALTLGGVDGLGRFGGGIFGEGTNLEKVESVSESVFETMQRKVAEARRDGIAEGREQVLKEMLAERSKPTVEEATAT